MSLLFEDSSPQQAPSVHMTNLPEVKFNQVVPFHPRRLRLQ